MKQLEYTLLTLLSFFFAYLLIYGASSVSATAIWFADPIIKLAQIVAILLVAFAFIGTFGTIYVALMNFYHYDNGVRNRRR